MLFLKILTVFTGISFIIYGISCLTTSHMKAEFKRYGLSKWRRLIGYLQIFGAIGLLLGMFYFQLAFYAALGLSVLMGLGFLTRLRIRDGFIQSSPSFLFMLVNVYLCITYYGML